MEQSTITLDEKMVKLGRELLTANEHQERKHKDWNDNYELYRNKVQTNRLTQRQAVNLPLMKETIKTIISKIDDAPNVDWKEKSSDEMKELIYQEIWNEQFKKQKIDWIDILDKKNVLLYGISTKKLNPTDDNIAVNVLDVFDIVFDPLMNPLDIETARFIIHKNIFRSVREILADDRYTTEGRDKLKMWAVTPYAMMQSGVNKEEHAKKMERLRAMGVQQNEFVNFAGGDVVVNLTEHYTLQWNPTTQKFERHVVVYADKWCELLDEKLEDLIGINEWPFVVWFEDPETNDIYPDGVADLVRTPNKVINVWYSQLVENRTLSNFRMHWYDATTEGYSPQTYEPGPGRMLPAPGDPNKTIMPVQVDGLDDSLSAIEFVTQIIERGSGAVAIDKGVAESGTQTLGEVEILVGKAMERSLSIQKFYRGAWYELATKWSKLMHANPPKKMDLYRTSASGKLYKKTVYASDWKSEAGYEPIISSTSEQEANEIKSVQKFMAIRAQYPDNIELKKITQSRQLEMLDFTPDELKRVKDYEEKLEQEKMRATEQPQTPQQPQPTQQIPQSPAVPAVDPEQEQLMQQIQDSLTQLA